MQRLLTLLAAWLMVPALVFGQPDWGVYPDGGTLYFYTTTLATTNVPTTLVNDAISVYKDGSATQLTTGASIDDDWDAVTGYHQIAINTTQSGFDAGSTYTVVYSGTATVDAISVVGKVIGSFRLANRDQFAGARTWYVDDTDGLGDLGTFDAPFDTYAQAESAANPGDTICFRIGTYTGTITPAKKNLTWLGESRSESIITAATTGVTGVITLSSAANGLTICNLTVNNTGGNGRGWAINANGCDDLSVKNCTLSGGVDGFQIVNCINCRFTGNHCTGQWDGGYFSAVDGLEIRDSSFITNGVYLTTAADKVSFHSGLNIGGCVGSARGCVFFANLDASSQLTSTDEAFGFRWSSGSVPEAFQLEFCKFRSLVDVVGYTGRAAGFGFADANPGKVAIALITPSFYVDADVTATTNDVYIPTGRNNRVFVYNPWLTGATLSTGVQVVTTDLAKTAGLQVTTIATLASQTSFTLTAGSADNDAYNRCLVVVTDATTSTQKAVGRIADYVGSTKTITLVSNPGIFTMATGDSISIVADTLQGGPYQTVQVPASRTLQVKSRGDGTYGVVGRVRMLAGEGPLWWAVNLAGTQLSPGDMVDSMTAPTPGGAQAANLTVADYGPQGTKALFKLTLSGSAATTDTITLPLPITMENDEVITVTVNVTVGS